MLVCSVRGCHLPLTLEERRVVCPRGHSFDIARSGYINLLQPQERRSKQPGDTREAVAARRRLHDRGVTRPLLNAIAEMAQGGTVLDAGCGEGFYLGSLAAANGCSGHGVDISTIAIDAAARRYPACEWIVANADRFIPYTDGVFDLVMSITARVHPVEFRRVLKPGGRALIAVPAPDDLIELRGAGKERIPPMPEFRLLDRRRVTATADLDAAAVEDVLVSIYRPMQQKEPEAMKLTFSLDLLLFEPA